MMRGVADACLNWDRNVFDFIDKFTSFTRGERLNDLP